MNLFHAVVRRWIEITDALWYGKARPMETYKIDHHYISTACLHDMHDLCRHICKYCENPCECRTCEHPVAHNVPTPDVLAQNHDYGDFELRTLVYDTLTKLLELAPTKSAAYRDLVNLREECRKLLP